MINVQKYDLDFELTIPYFNNNLNGANLLSTSLITSLNFNYGKFFTFLPFFLKYEELYDFRRGGIAKGSRDKTCTYIIDFLKNNINFFPIFDDVNSKYDVELNNDRLFSNSGYYYNDEVYYFLKNTTINFSLIKDYLIASNAIWHSLCVLSFIAMKSLSKSRKLSLIEINEICKNTKMIVLGAYDGEGYIFWEKL